MRFAKLVGRDNVIAGADCGFSSQACYHTEVHPKIIWTKFRALTEGARLASKQLWAKKPARAAAKAPAKAKPKAKARKKAA